MVSLFVAVSLSMTRNIMSLKRILGGRQDSQNVDEDIDMTESIFWSRVHLL